ncbi:ABC transporter permease [Pseudoclavibacter alba]|uniref:Transport permease protein n=1 Tax=Pseudoclavibacter albus TaxID=272241 RepID=A0ABT2HYG8_9MICO|nr:ABC transporter permease [Pseudoclavibacter alba]MCT2043372.1 ABC transporter permease [Pseudoclavibacter alba]
MTINELELAQQRAQIRAARLEQQPLEEIGPRGGFITGPFLAARELFRHRSLLDLLVRRELKAKYKDSALGFLWSLSRPLTQLLIYALVLGEFLGASRSISHFAIFIFSGLTVYGLFSELVMTGTAAIVANTGLVKKVYLPREIFAAATVGGALFNFVIQLALLAIAAVVMGTFHAGGNLLYAVLGFLVALVWGFAMGLALGAANVYLRDMQYTVEIIVTLLMWFSPIVYSWTFVPGAFAQFGWPDWLFDVYMASPITLAVIAFQYAFWGAAPGAMYPDHLGLHLAIAFLVGCVALWLAQRIFAKLEGNFAQEL